MGGIIGLIVVLIGVLFWVMAGVGYNRGLQLGRYFIHLGSCAVIIFILWLIIVKPMDGCSGFLCGLAEFILFLILSVILFTVWGLVLYISSNKMNNNQASNSDISSSILDEEF